jgi:competence protein CoiA
VLSCLLNSQYIEASKNLNRELDFKCPQCHSGVILKAGSKNIAHFSHAVNSLCKHGIGETKWHRMGKQWVASFFRKRGDEVRFEMELGNRRTDVLVTKRGGKKVAVEFQRKDEGVALYKRTNDLLRYVDEVIWVFPWNVKRVDWKYRATATYGLNALYTDKERLRAKIMFYDSSDDVLFLCDKRPWYKYVEQTDFGGGFDKKLSRWCELIILKEFRN